MPTRPCCHSTTRNVVRGFAKDRFVLGQQRCAPRETFERRAPERLSARRCRRRGRHRPAAAARCAPAGTSRVLADAVDHGILEERERRQAGEAVVGEHVDEVAVDGAVDGRPRRSSHNAAVAVNGPQVEERAGEIHLLAHRILDPAAVARLPLLHGRDVERRLEWRGPFAAGSRTREASRARARSILADAARLRASPRSRRDAAPPPVSDSARPAAPLKHQHTATSSGPASASTRVTIATSTRCASLASHSTAAASVRCSSVNARARRFSVPQFGRGSGRTDSTHDVAGCSPNS